VDMERRKEEKGKGKKLARSLLFFVHRTHFNGCVPCLFGVGQDGAERERKGFVYFSWLEAVTLPKEAREPFGRLHYKKSLIGKFVLSEAKRVRREARQRLDEGFK
jgi:hypothetical protein